MVRRFVASDSERPSVDVSRKTKICSMGISLYSDVFLPLKSGFMTNSVPTQITLKISMYLYHKNVIGDFLNKGHDIFEGLWRMTNIK
jgi:hypothetical protein